jgi:hypothetical protein
MRRSEHLGGFLLALLLVILGGRAIAYAATPTPLAAQLGGPRLPVITVVALALAAAISLGVLWLAALGVRERHALDRAEGPAPRLALARFCQDAVLLGGSSLLGFAALETWLHSRAGMHMHWWMCLEGPVHRNAIPILFALSLAAAALLGALRHALAWARRVVHVLRRLLQPRAARRPQTLVLGHLTAPAWLLARALRARGPPSLFFP